MRAEIRPSTAEDFVAFKGRLPPYRCRAFTGLIDGEIKGIGGLAFPPDGTALAFVELTDDARRYAVTLHRAALKTIAEAKARGIRKIVATATPGVEAAPRWLIKLGFEPTQVDGQTVYIWHSSGND